MKKKTEKLDRKPFFVRFLEGQELERAQGAKPDQTMKYPSDGDEI
jgi:hypothetical protein